MPGRAEIDGGHKEASTLADWPPSPTLDRSGYLLELEDRFESAALADIWLPHYLPQWSSRERSAARYQVGGGRLRLLIEADQPAWSPEYAGGLRVSSLQTGVFSGPAGSTIGQHRYRDGLIVREAQPAQRLYTPRYGLFELRARFSDDPATVAALWLIGFEDEPHRSAELCIVEIFGRNVGPRRAGIGMGLH
ncbi:MAG TPA: glycoside hydrolase family 16 protein, partial [Candidatus Limnocylindria bacterium]|nr:glycoside hydrolase family 16 protein [Candidatus Limnocylindria bacterium]